MPLIAQSSRPGARIAIGLAVVLAATSAHAAASEPQPLAEIRSAAIAALGGGDLQAEATLDPALRLARCSQPLQAISSGLRTAQVRCADIPGWRLYVPVRIRREADVVVLTAPAAPGVPIAASQLAVQRRDVSLTTGATFSNPASLVGRVPDRALAAGMMPTQVDLSMGVPLRRGDPLVLVSRTGGVEVRVQGSALGPARAGGLVVVENTTTHRVLRGRVAAEGVVEIMP